MNKKLIVVANRRKVQYFLAKGIKLKDLLEEHNIEELNLNHIIPSKHDGFFNKRSQQSHFFDPHTDPKDLIKEDFAKVIVKQIEKTHGQKHFDQIILIAEPQILGHIRKNLSNIIGKLVAKEIPKDLVDSSVEIISKNLFV